MNLKDPQTPAEWQEAVNVAAALRAIHDCKLYGLIQGGPEINIERCDELLEAGLDRGITPQGNRGDLAIALVQQINAGIEKTNVKGKYAGS